jgi:ABC-type Fe3+/spermidine/putrescine transport system ATPase subunit
MADVAIRLTNVSKEFDGASGAAVGNLSLDIERGTIMALLGPSGCGKTTTLRMINRLIEPTSGTIEINGVDVMSQSAQELRRGIGYVIQQVGLFPHRTIASNIATVPSMVGWNKQRTAARVEELTALVGLEPEPSPSIHRSCSWTSRSAPSTRSSGRGSRTNSSTCRRRSARRSSSSPMTSTRHCGSQIGSR